MTYKERTFVTRETLLEANEITLIGTGIYGSILVLNGRKERIKYPSTYYNLNKVWRYGSHIIDKRSSHYI